MAIKTATLRKLLLCIQIPPPRPGLREQEQIRAVFLSHSTTKRGHHFYRYSKNLKTAVLKTVFPDTNTPKATAKNSGSDERRINSPPAPVRRILSATTNWVTNCSLSSSVAALHCRPPASSRFAATRCALTQTLCAARPAPSSDVHFAPNRASTRSIGGSPGPSHTDRNFPPVCAS